MIGQIREMRDKLGEVSRRSGTGYSPREAALSGLKADASLESRAELELEMGSPSAAMGDLLKIGGW